MKDIAEELLIMSTSFKYWVSFDIETLKIPSHWKHLIMHKLLFNCGIFCMILSIWATIQLTIMGILYQIETVVLIEDVAAEEYTDYDDFIKKTKKNYTAVAINCWISAAIYLLMIGISYMCLRKARNLAKTDAAMLDDDELSCRPPDRKQKKK